MEGGRECPSYACFDYLMRLLLCLSEVSASLQQPSQSVDMSQFSASQVPQQVLGGAVLFMQVLPSDALRALVKLKLHTKGCSKYGWNALHYACAAQRVGECLHLGLLQAGFWGVH